MNLLTTSKLGQTGEEIACDFLLSRGHQILDRNWRSGHLELDIVTEAADGLHFVEVKSRTAPVSAAPEENVTPLKQRRLVSAAHAYLNEKHPGDLDVYFDIVTVVFDGERTDIQYYKQAFIPIYT